MGFVGTFLKSISSIILSVIKFLVAAAAVVGVPFLVFMLLFFIFYLIKGRRLKKRTVKRKKPIYASFFPYNKDFLSVLKRLFIDFPRRFVLDLFERDPDHFDTFGVHVFAGEQGSGKTIAAMHFIKMIKERNPLCKIASNIDIDFQDDVILDWTKILELNNNEFGQVIMIDELQNWFSSLESKNFPPEMLTEITQQRKQRKIIVGTSQVFTRLAKPIREQITLLYRPITLFGCLTFVRVYKLRLTEDGTVDQMILRKVYFFVHDRELRSCYDTYEKVKRVTKVGFQERSDQIQNLDPPHVPAVPSLEVLKDRMSKKSKVV